MSHFFTELCDFITKPLYSVAFLPWKIKQISLYAILTSLLNLYGLAPKKHNHNILQSPYTDTPHKRKQFLSYNYTIPFENHASKSPRSAYAWTTVESTFF